MHEQFISSGDEFPFDNASDASARKRVKIGHICKLQIPFLGRGEDRGCERMLAGALETGDQAEQFFIPHCLERRDASDSRLAFGERAGFVDDERVDFFHGLEGFGILDQDSGVGAAAGADHDGHGSGEAEGAGAGDDQNRDGVHQRVREARLRTEQEPGGESDGGDGDDCGHEPGGNAIGEALDGSAAALGLSDELDDAGEQRFGADALGAHDERSGAR